MKIIIADDHELILSGLETKIKNHFPQSEIIKTIHKTALFEALKNNEIDILLQDIKFGFDDARDFINEIKEKYPKLKIIVLSSISDSVSIQKIINKGIDAYVLKSESSDEIILAIENVILGKKHFSDEIEKRIQKPENSSQIILTRREKEILEVIMKEKSTKEIAEILSISEKTVEMHRSSLFIKMDVKNITGLVKKVIALGLLDE